MRQKWLPKIEKKIPKNDEKISIEKNDFKVSSSQKPPPLLKSVQVLKKKVLRSDKKANGDLERQLHEVLSATLPNNSPQERVYGWLVFTHKDAHSAFFDALLPHFDPLNQGVQVWEFSPAEK